MFKRLNNKYSLYISILLFLFLLSLFKNSVVFSVGTFSKSINNPVLSPSTSNWDDGYTMQPSIIRSNDGIYNMWYAGFDGSRFHIGYASSTNGENWIPSSSPAISRILLDNRDSHDPTVISDGNSHEMWYVSSTGGGSSDFKIQRAVNTTGTWTNNPVQPILSPSQNWWDSEGLSSPFVLKTPDGYKMWYSALKNVYWRIGYATSPDGINWTPYAGNPIIDLSGQGKHADGPSVIYNGTDYEMFFHGVDGDLSYTTSSDGITNWSTPVKVLTRDAGTFDSQSMNGPSALRLPNGTTLLYYGGLGTLGGVTAWRIGLAADGPIQIPTPTPIPVTKVVLVPGLAGSWNQDALLLCKDSGYSGGWTSWKKSDEIYLPFLQTVDRAGLTPLPFYYDWRRDPRDSAQALKTFIDAQTVANERIYLVGHSLGGLVARAYLEQEGGNAKVARYVSVGSPHEGTPVAYYAWSGGKIIGNDDWRIGGTLMLTVCRVQDGLKSPRRIIQEHAPVVQSLLPTYEYLRSKSANQLKPIHTLAAQNNWLPNALFPQPFFDIGVGSLAGTGWKTIKEIIVSNPNRIDMLLGNWTDGRPVKDVNTNGGDNFILTTSALIPGSQTDTIVQNHGGLISLREGISRIFFLLGLPEPLFVPLSFHQPEPTNALFVFGDTKKLSIKEPSGRTLESDDGILYIPNPADGNFALDIYPKGKSTNIGVIQILKNDITLWRTYDLNGTGRIRRNIRFSRDTPKDDILQL